MPRQTANSIASADVFDTIDWERGTTPMSRSNSQTRSGSVSLSHRPSPAPGAASTSAHHQHSNERAGSSSRASPFKRVRANNKSPSKNAIHYGESSEDEVRPAKRAKGKAQAAATPSRAAATPNKSKNKGKAKAIIFDSDETLTEPDDSDSLTQEGDSDDDDDAAMLAAINDTESLLDSASGSDNDIEDDELQNRGYTEEDEADGEEEDGEDDDSDGSDNGVQLMADEEARIIADEEKRLARKRAKRARRAAADHAWGMGAQGGGEEFDSDEERNQWPLATSMSPRTLRALGLGKAELGDELFEQQHGFRTDSEPSFTDFFDDTEPGEDEDDVLSSDGIGADADEDGANSEALTTDDDSSLDEGFFALEAAMMTGEPFMVARGQGEGEEEMMEETMEGLLELDSDDAAEAQRRAEMPLLVIEDLDGRLIYARAGDGEAVFGSDGEFEFLGDDDEDDDDWTDFEDDIYNAIAGPTAMSRRPSAEIEVDDGETTDELPDEDKQFNRLLVGSIAPRGGRRARQQQALAARSRRLSPNAGTHSRQRSNTGGELVAPSIAHSRNSSIQSLDLAPITPPNEVPPTTVAQKALATPRPSTGGNAGASRPSTPATPHPKPTMGSFTTSANSKHRAVIDGLRQAPSPFSLHNRVRNKGLGLKTKRKRGSDVSRFPGVLDLDNSDLVRPAYRHSFLDRIVGRGVSRLIRSHQPHRSRRASTRASSRTMQKTSSSSTWTTLSTRRCCGAREAPSRPLQRLIVARTASIQRRSRDGLASRWAPSVTASVSSNKPAPRSTAGRLTRGTCARRLTAAASGRPTLLRSAAAR